LGATANDIATWEGQINKAADAYGKLFQKNKQLSGLLNPADLIKPATGGGGKGGSLKTISDLLAEIQTKFASVDTLAKGLGQSEEQIATEKIEILYSYLQKIADIGGPGAVKAIKNLVEQANQLQGSAFLPTLTGGRAGVTGLGSPFAGGVGVPTHAVGTPGNLGQSKDFTKKQIEQFKELNKQGEILDRTFENVFSAIAQGANPFQALIQSVEQLIIKLAAAAAAAAILNALTGGSAVAVGAFGGGGGFTDIFKSLLHFGTGGFVGGPTVAVIGDAPGGEWVLNQKQISAILNGAGGGNGRVHVTGVLIGEGSSLKAVIDTTTRKQNRRG
jgi:hypothetical protein